MRNLSITRLSSTAHLNMFSFLPVFPFLKKIVILIVDQIHRNNIISCQSFIKKVKWFILVICHGASFFETLHLRLYSFPKTFVITELLCIDAAKNIITIFYDYTIKICRKQYFPNQIISEENNFTNYLAKTFFADVFVKFHMKKFWLP